MPDQQDHSDKKTTTRTKRKANDNPDAGINDAIMRDFFNSCEVDYEDDDEIPFDVGTTEYLAAADIFYQATKTKENPTVKASRIDYTQTAEKYGMQLLDVPHDGNCFYSALLQYLSNVNSPILREIATAFACEVAAVEVSHLRKLAIGAFGIISRTAGFSHLDENGRWQVIMQHRVNGCWADGHMIAPLAVALGIDIVTILSSGGANSRVMVVRGGNNGRAFVLNEQTADGGGLHFQTLVGAPNPKLTELLPSQPQQDHSNLHITITSSLAEINTIEDTIAAAEAAMPELIENLEKTWGETQATARAKFQAARQSLFQSLGLGWHIAEGNKPTP